MWSQSVGEQFVLFWVPAHIFNMSGDLKRNKTLSNIGRLLIDSGDSEIHSTAILLQVILCYNLFECYFFTALDV